MSKARAVSLKSFDFTGAGLILAIFPHSILPVGMSFAHLPDDVYNVIFAQNKLTLYDFGRIAQTCRTLAEFFRTNDEIWHIGCQKRFPGVLLPDEFAHDGYTWRKYFAACTPTLASFCHFI